MIEIFLKYNKLFGSILMIISSFILRIEEENKDIEEEQKVKEIKKTPLNF